jgi:DNA primase
MDNLTFPEAVKKLAERSGIALRESSSRKAASTLGPMQDALARSIDFYHKKLLEPKASEAYEYLHSRGFNDDIIDMFYLGFAPDEWDALAKHLRISGVILKASGLGFVNKAGRQQDFMRNRIIFPIYDAGGRPIAMGGRILPGSEEAKYKNSPETLLYSKKKTLYGLHLAKADIVNSNQAIICEGYTDVISFFKSGLPRAVATCGTALSEDHFNVLRRFTSNIVLAYDADQAGQSGQERFYQWERNGDVNVSVAVMPEGCDPAELSLSDPRALLDAVEHAVPFMRFRLERIFAAHDLSHPEGRAKAAAAALEALSAHTSTLLQDQYIMLISDRCKIHINTLRKELEAVNRRSHNSRPAPPGSRVSQTGNQTIRRGTKAGAGNGDAGRSDDTRGGNTRSNDARGGNTRNDDAGDSSAGVGGTRDDNTRDETDPNFEADNEEVTRNVNRAVESIYSNPQCRAELEALRIAIHHPQEIAEFIEGYLFYDDTLREVYEYLANSQTLRQAIDSASTRNRIVANLLNRLALEEPQSPPLGVISQLARKVAERSIQDVQAQVRMDNRDAGEAARYIAKIKIALEIFGEESDNIEPLEQLIKLLKA